MEKLTLINNLSAWIKQRPGLDFGNYGDIKSYRAELRGITKDYQDASELLAFVALRDSITADDIIKASEYAFSGRLTLADDGTIEYCTGQYWPTEYRAAVCAVLARVIRGYLRDGRDGRDTGDAIRKAARAEFGRGIVSRWFN